ncbi:hypothetical protein J4573_16350 [Actinomadura barringtoniae]|uniref:Uncharacterized protein n=1 Tax=Actinomadura barringtoniae TaxID=1427535 RepID=A0A939T4T8_9ACTN|nr:hypothetical protein [Actinomadura barringtoniae]MBO2448674.1 hypothetical protein [Actinomadura barringtoniae]
MNIAADSWLQRFQTLLEGGHTATGDELDAGAQLVVTDQDGTESFRASLARHWRIDDEDGHTIWVRPILASYREDDGTTAFNLSLARRRALSWTNAVLDGDGLVFHLRSGETANVQPATDAELAELRRWDAFYFTTLAQEEAEALDELADDSWHGRFA